MHVITVLVVQAPRYAKNGANTSMVQADCNRAASVLTRNVEDRYFVRDKIAQELNGYFSSIERFAGGWIKLEVSDKRTVRDVTRRVDLIIEANKEARYPQTEEPFSRC